MRYSSGGTGYGGVVLGIHHAQNVIYYACPCPLRDAQVGKPGHARFNCVKGEFFRKSTYISGSALAEHPKYITHFGFCLLFFCINFTKKDCVMTKTVRGNVYNQIHRGKSLIPAADFV